MSPMIRFDFQTTVVMLMATASSLSVAFVLNHVDQRGRAEAAEIAPVAVSAPALPTATRRPGAARIIDTHRHGTIIDGDAAVVAANG